MNISFWIDEHKGFFRFMILILFIVSITGPWMLEQLHVPAEYACSPPTIRLEGDFCGSPLSGFRFLVWFAGGFFYILFELIRGVFPGHPRELLSGLSLLLVFPVFTTFLLLTEKESRRLLTINLILWILAFLLSLTAFISQMNDQAIRLWGLWLYILVSFGAIIFEFFIIKQQPDQA